MDAFGFSNAGPFKTQLPRRRAHKESTSQSASTYSSSGTPASANQSHQNPAVHSKHCSRRKQLLNAQRQPPPIREQRFTSGSSGFSQSRRSRTAQCGVEIATEPKIRHASVNDVRFVRVKRAQKSLLSSNQRLMSKSDQ